MGDVEEWLRSLPEDAWSGPAAPEWERRLFDAVVRGADLTLVGPRSSRSDRVEWLALTLARAAVMGQTVHVQWGSQAERAAVGVRLQQLLGTLA